MSSWTGERTGTILNVLLLRVLPFSGTVSELHAAVRESALSEQRWLVPERLTTFVSMLNQLRTHGHLQRFNVAYQPSEFTADGNVDLFKRTKKAS